MSRVVAKSRTHAVAKAPKVKAPKTNTIKSTKADPLSEDEFEREGREEAAEYARIQQNEQERNEQRNENQLLRAQGRPVKPLPRKIKVERKRFKVRSESEESEDSDLDDNRARGRSGRMGMERRRKGDGHFKTAMPEGREDELEYEGQVILPFNPLYELAGLVDEEAHSREVELAKKAMLDAYFARRDGLGQPGPSTTASASASKMTMRNGCLVKKESAGPEVKFGRDPTAADEIALPRASVEEAGAVRDERSKRGAGQEEEEEGEGEEAPEGDYDDEIIVAPWSQVPRPSGDVAIKDEPGLREEEASEEGEEVEEGTYSDDEYLGDTTASSLGPDYSLGTQMSASVAALGPEVPDVKPVFPFTDVQAQIGPLLLDGAAGPAIPAPLNRFLKPYQRAGVQFMYKLYSEGKGGILGDDMGLGKTVQVISFLSAIMRKTGTKADFRRRKDLIRQGAEGRIAPKHWPTALIVCPSSLVRNWERELMSWGYFETAIWTKSDAVDLATTFRNGFLDILLCSYEHANLTIEVLKELPFSVTIVDEAHRLKEPRATRTQAMKKIRCNSCFALTGTLIQNRMDEMWSVLDFVQRGWAGTFREWREFAVNPIKRGHRLEGSTEDVVLGIKRLGEVHTKVLPHFYLRRDKRLIAHELPEKRDMVVFCPLAEKQILAYQRLIDSDDIQFIVRRNEPCECGSDLTRLHCHHKRTAAGESVRDVVLKNITALSKVANHYGLLYHSQQDTDAVRAVNAKIFEVCAGRPYDNRRDNAVTAALDPDNCGKWTLLAELLKQWRSEKEKKNKVLIFSNSVRLLRMIDEFISTSFSGFEHAIFTGEVGGKERMQMVDDFQDPNQDHYILLISTQAGGVGLNLTAANKVVIFDPDWNPANDLQAMDRAFRIGQQRTVEVYRMIGLGTLEELKYERQIHKQQRARQLNDGTFERRIHQGIEGGKGELEQGELFGTHNIFRFNPNGFVAGNLERVQAAEDKFTQDLIEAEYDEAEEAELRGVEAMDEDEAEAKRIRNQRRDLEIQRARRARMEAKENNAKIDDVLGGESREAPKDEDIMTRLGVKSHVHETAFKDSPEERQIFEMGMQLLRDNPELARSIKAYDIGKHAPRPKRASVGSTRSTAQGGGGAGSSLPRERKASPEMTDEPWAARIAKRSKPAGKLIELSDDD